MGIQYVHTQLIQYLLIDLLGCQFFLGFHHGVRHMIVEHGRRNDLLVRVPACLQLRGGVHIHHQL